MRGEPLGSELRGFVDGVEGFTGTVGQPIGKVSVPWTIRGNRVHERSTGVNGQLEPPPLPLHPGRIPFCIHHPQQVPLLGKASFRIKAAVGGGAAWVEGFFAGLRSWPLSALGIFIDEPAAKLVGGGSLSSAQLVDQLVSVEVHPPLGVDRTAVDAVLGLEERDWNFTATFQDLPGERGPALALREITLVGDQSVCAAVAEGARYDAIVAEAEAKGAGLALEGSFENAFRFAEIAVVVRPLYPVALLGPFDAEILKVRVDPAILCGEN